MKASVVVLGFALLALVTEIAGAADGGQICWKSTTPRGVGKPVGSCSGADQAGALCYPKCKDGYTGIGPVCWEKACPAGYTRDDGTTCWRDVKSVPKDSYGISGYPWKAGDPPLPNNSKAKERCEKDHGGGRCHEKASIWYPHCRDGYRLEGDRCYQQKCPADADHDEPGSCRWDTKTHTKGSYGRGVGTPMNCESGTQYDAGLCYKPCPADSRGVGPLCWKGCPADYPVECKAGTAPGAACGKSEADCVAAVLTMVQSTGEVMLNVASFVSGAGPAAKPALQAAQTSAKSAGKTAYTTAARQTAKQALKSKLKDAGKELAENSPQMLEIASEAALNSKEAGEFDWTVLDPTGIAAMAQSFNKPMCAAPAATGAAAGLSTFSGKPLLTELNGKCIDVPEGKASPGAKLAMWDCGGGENQKFTLTSAGHLKVQGMCVDALGGKGNKNDEIGLWSCVDGAPNHTWQLTSDGHIKGINGRCVDIAGGNTANGAKLVLWDCVSVSHQKFKMGK